jgi:hypothetical protein
MCDFGRNKYLAIKSCTNLYFRQQTIVRMIMIFTLASLVGEK